MLLKTHATCHITTNHDTTHSKTHHTTLTSTLAGYSSDTCEFNVIRYTPSSSSFQKRLKHSLRVTFLCPPPLRCEQSVEISTYKMSAWSSISFTTCGGRIKTCKELKNRSIRK